MQRNRKIVKVVSSARSTNVTARKVGEARSGQSTCKTTKPVSTKAAPLLVAAIDFGTTYSGTAYSFRHEYEKDPTKVYARPWSGGTLMSEKTPTCVLIAPDGKTLEAFGYDAEERFSELAADDKHKEYYYFKHFKMLLFEHKGLQRNTVLYDNSGKQLPAKTVFAVAIKFLKDDLVEMCRTRLSATIISPKDIHWVLTVPAIWEDAAKQFMREAATDKDFAAIPGEMLTIALEPEAASLYCQHLQVMKGTYTPSVSKFQPGTKYMVVDAGGGTVDVSVHEIKEDNTLKELYKASGGSWGGTNVDHAFTQFLIQIVGNDAWTTFQRDHMDDYIDMFRDWEVKKRKCELKANSKMTLRMPVSLTQIVTEENKGRLPFSTFKDKIEYKAGKIRVDNELVKQHFIPTIDNIINHLRGILENEELRDLSNLLLVGGFSECKLLQEAIRYNFPDKAIIIPNDAGLAVLKGAVIFGHSTTHISERVARLTYGMKGDIQQGNKRSSKVDPLCTDVFHTHVTIGQTLRFDEAQSEIFYMPIDDDQTSYTLKVYASTETCPKYVTDGSCQHLGNIYIDGIYTKDSGLARGIRVRMYFGRTELKVEVEKNATGEVTQVQLDCM